uniref:NSE1 homolog, SMC5-SMC6 complex component n=1 Tax=Hucho hucho TaxID=62062 RepID=A0A4W5NB94_9TELE
MAQPLGESHKRFLQTMMVNGIIDGAKVRALHRHCSHYAHDKPNEFIEVINAQLQPMFMQIRKGMSEEDGLQYHALMDLIVDSDNGSASSTDILNCMEPYIRMLYQDQVKVCIFTSQCQMCENPTCGIKIHTPCVARYFKGRTDP